MSKFIDSVLDKTVVSAYQLPQAWGIVPDIVISEALSDDDRLWVSLGEDTWSRPLHLSTSGGYYAHLLKVKKAGLLQRHRHSGGVHAYVLKGSWFYLEHEWIATEGSYIYEPPGETHTLMVSTDCAEMITLFIVHGPLIFVNPEGVTTGYEDVFTRIEKYRQHFQKVGLGADYVQKFIR